MRVRVRVRVKVRISPNPSPKPNLGRLDDEPRVHRGEDPREQPLLRLLLAELHGVGDHLVGVGVRFRFRVRFRFGVRVRVRARARVRARVRDRLGLGLGDHHPAEHKVEEAVEGPRGDAPQLAAEEGAGTPPPPQRGHGAPGWCDGWW